ncbi:hypothetical protein FE246_08280 [Aliarcobacter thereius]|uniref:Uncharacterized protein n=1 Tax=Aliarcobacter thereius TaxID=544718 RepID=A0A5R9H8L3_9BACT|nr:hypothetical protein [Aliarcobacter thereius]TLS70955.1 hypothetical protein FE246_08280 [Aliarcobacter thereius]
MAKRIDEKMLLRAEPILAIGQKIDDFKNIIIEINLLDKNKKPLTSRPLEKTIDKAEKTKDIKNILKEYNSEFKGEYIIKDITSAKEVAEKLEIEETDKRYSQISYLSFRIDANCSGKFDKSEAEKWFDVEIVKTKLHFLFFTLSGSKNDLIFLEMLNKREENIKNSIDYDKNIDIIYKYRISSSSEILEYAKIIIEQNGGQNKVEIKNVELFAEIFENKKENIKKDTKIDTSSHWIDNLAKPYIPKNTNINEATEKINSSVKHKEYMNKVYNDNKDKFVQELKESSIRGLGYVDQVSTAVLLTTKGKLPFNALVFFSLSSIVSKYAIHKLKDERIEKFAIKIIFDTFVDIVAGNNSYMQVGNEVIFKPYFIYISEEVEQK